MSSPGQFGWALDKLKDGHSVTRPEWGSVLSMFTHKSGPMLFTHDPKPIDAGEKLNLFTYHPGNSDLFADDWEISDE